jgi:Rrf2 family protein
MKSSELAELVGTTSGFLSQAMTPLVAQGWVRSDPGPTGGYVALVELDAVSVLDVIEAVEGPTHTGRCVLEDRPCSGGEMCALHVPWSRARDHLLAELASTPLSTLGSGSGAP